MLDEVNGYTVDLFSNSIISAILNFFSMLAWGLGLLGAGIAVMDFCVSYRTGGGGSFLGTGMNMLRLLIALLTFSSIPVLLFQFSMDIYGSVRAAAVGSMIRDGADEQGYDPAVTAATNAASSCSGLLIPPSNALITYSLASGGTSVAALFMAGYIPGIIWALCCCVVGVLLAVKLGYKGTPGKFDWKNLGICTLRALPSLSLIIVVIGGIIGGVFSATEGSAIAVVYALILAFCYRSINLKSLWKILVDSAKMSGMVVFLVGVSNILGWVMAFLQIPDAVAAALLSLTSNKYIILLIMNVILLVSGTFMDVTPAILIFTPLFLPICQSFGMSTIQFGLILVYNLCIGNITPPVGNALFVGIKVGRTSLSKVMPYMLMYYVAIIGGLLLVTFIPAVSTALPQAMGLM